MSRPYDLYIRFLFTTGLSSVSLVNEKLKEISLAPIDQDELISIGGEVLAAVPGGIEKQIDRKVYGPDFIPWMEYLDVKDLWVEDKKSLKTIYDIHSDKRYRLSLNGLLMKKMPVSDIRQVLNLKFSAGYSEQQLDIYHRFFFNPERMRRSDWVSYLKVCDPQERHIYFTALSSGLEEVKAELDLSASVSVSEELSKLLRKSLNKANYYMKISTKEANFEARSWIDTALKLTDKYEKYRSADSTDFSKSLQMEFEYIDNEFPVPDEATLTALNSKLKAKEEIEDKDQER